MLILLLKYFKHFIIVERDSKKRQIKPSQSFFSIDDIAESSDDSDFKIEEHSEEETDDNSDISDSNDEHEASSSSTFHGNSVSTKEETGSCLEQKQTVNTELPEDIVMKHLICSVCLGDKSDDSNEIIECDGCGVTVHEANMSTRQPTNNKCCWLPSGHICCKACYGVQENISLSSTTSSCSTEPWFCEACRAGVVDPCCELCPNTGGIFKETDVGQWVHLVCALYMPNIKFGDVDALNNITLSDLPYTRWGSKPCQYCEDQRLVGTGITIGCDAGMCRIYFHVTCGQREGLLSDSTEEVMQADPYFAHCKLHSDKNYMRKKRGNWLVLQARIRTVKNKLEKERLENEPSWCRNQRKLTSYKRHYSQQKAAYVPPIIPTQKTPRLLTTNAAACRALWRKSELMGYDTAAYEETESQINALREVPRKWNVPPAFSVEFVAYFFNRDSRVKKMKEQLSDYQKEKERLTAEQRINEEKYKSVEAEHTSLLETNASLKNAIQKYYDFISATNSGFKIPDIDTLDRSESSPAPSTIHSVVGAKGAVLTVAALKAGVGFPLRLQKDSSTSSNLSIDTEMSPIVLNKKCGTCSQSNEPHLMARCDTCKRYYHLSCLIPPLTRMPKKTKQMGWQCSECDRDTHDSDSEHVDTDAPRKLRRFSGDREFHKSGSFSENGLDNPIDDTADAVAGIASGSEADTSARLGKKRRRGKHRNRYSPDLIFPIGKHHSRKRKRKNTPPSTELTEITTGGSQVADQPRQGIKLFIKSVPNPSVSSDCSASTPASTTSTFVAKTEEYITSSAGSPSSSSVRQKTTKVIENQCERCDTCNNIGTNLNMVKCDECFKCFHFGCLDPPVKKSPKVRGYSWHCASCDPTDTDSD